MKNKITFFILLFSVIASVNIFVIIPVKAADDIWKVPDIEIAFPDKIFQHDVKCTDNKDGTKTCSVPWMADYIVAIYKYAVGAIGIIAVVVMMLGGVTWITAGGNPSRVGEAKSWITASLIGLLLITCSYTILYFINPSLVNLKPIEITTIKPVAESALPSCRAVEKTMNDDGTSAAAICDKDETQEDLKKCGLKSNLVLPDGAICCCQQSISLEEWKFDNKIEAQITDASPSLITLITCIEGQLPSDAGIISSISDSNVMGDLSQCNKPNCDLTKCQHACQSCHYGGGLPTNKSYAVDFGNEKYAKEIIAAAKICGAGFWMGPEQDPVDHWNHVHVSTSDCPKN